MLVSIPLDSCSVLARQLFPGHLICISERSEWRLIPRNVEIFVKGIQDELQEFLGILLFVNPPVRIEVSTDFLKNQLVCICINLMNTLL